MVRQGIKVAVVLLLAACIGQFKSVAQVFDLSAEFSLEKNPNRVWEYGYSAAQSLDPADFRRDQSSNITVPIGFWHPASNHGPGPGYYPYVAFNTSRRTEYGSSKGWAARPRQVAMEASNTGQYSIVRFVAPRNGKYEIVARFEGIHFGPSTTDVHVMHNRKSLFEAEIEGYGGDPAFHAVEGAHPTAFFSGEVNLKAHETVDFAVGYGKNRTHFGDTTGLFAEIKLLKEK